MGIRKYIMAFKHLVTIANDMKDIQVGEYRNGLSKVDSTPDLFDLMSRCIAAHKHNGLVEIEAGSEIGHSWRHTLEELIHSGAFSVTQVEALKDQMFAAEREIATKKVHIQATKIIFGVKDEKYYTTNIMGGIITTNPVTTTTVTGTVYANQYVQTPWK